jgi:hypothetical protein
VTLLVIESPLMSSRGTGLIGTSINSTKTSSGIKLPKLDTLIFSERNEQTYSRNLLGTL